MNAGASSHQKPRTSEVGVRTPSSLHARTTGNQGLGVRLSMVEANDLIVLHLGQCNVAVGDEVGVMMSDRVI